MKCPNCSFKTNSINELSVYKSDMPWYKYNEEQIMCPECKTPLKLTASREVLFPLIFIFFIYITIALVSYIYSTVVFFLFCLFIAISLTPLINYILNEKGVLIERNT